MTEGKPFLRVVRGDPSPAEVAALVAVLTARARAAAAARDGADEPRTSRWADRSRLVRTTASGGIRPRGPGAWRAGGLPR
ncbi:acyl-CoA carboxylase subunit epsilon [Actinomadura rubrisoli]|uniref:Acyl-CoA carboxylase subunit epsilon n=1 Tax=Actinomadura rubrisoli TaxID=2530368 RepID=A0A4R5AA32_9ACTN|nr:acyl-CoA carboxylase subunit epsilon [Actinomadura rubrisoli]TDD67584.1 acyl-CoA carboxylase subunit epsilon [Actinomadura rubrisoli]